MHHPARRCRSRAAFTLVEVIIVLGVLAILASLIIPAMHTAGAQSLQSAARKLAADLRLARSLAVQTGSDWSVEFDLATNSYEVTHTGVESVPTLRNPLAAAGQEEGPYEVSFNGVSAGGNLVQQIVLIGVALEQSRAPVTDVTFHSGGGTGPSRAEDTLIWIGDRSETGARYVRIRISWITGQVWVDPLELYDADDLDLLYE